MKFFVGLDVSLAKTSVCVISEHGKIFKEAETESDPMFWHVGCMIWMAASR